MKKDIYRKKALEQMASPEQLDELFSVVKVNHWYALVATSVLLLCLFLWGMYGEVAVWVEGKGLLVEGEGFYKVSHQNQSKVQEILVEVGEQVAVGAPLIRLEDLSTQEQIVVKAPAAGSVMEIYSYEEEYVAGYDPLLTLVEKVLESEELYVRAYIPLDEGKELRRGMEVHVAPSNINTIQYGRVKGIVKTVSQYPITEAAMLDKVGSQAVIKALTYEGPYIEVVVELEKEYTPSGYAFTIYKGPKEKLKSGTLCDVQVVTQHERPIELLFPFLK